MSKGYKSWPKKVPNDQGLSNLSDKIDNVVLDYSWKYKMNIYEFILM